MNAQLDILEILQQTNVVNAQANVRAVLDLLLIVLVVHQDINYIHLKWNVLPNVLNLLIHKVHFVLHVNIPVFNVHQKQLVKVVLQVVWLVPDVYHHVLLAIIQIRRWYANNALRFVSNVLQHQLIALNAPFQLIYTTTHV